MLSQTVYTVREYRFQSLNLVITILFSVCFSYLNADKVVLACLVSKVISYLLCFYLEVGEWQERTSR